MRRLILGLALIAVGCNLFPAAITPPQFMNLVPGGISNTNPYFGTYKPQGSAGAQVAPVGNFLLASCGCGDWRVLFRPYDGSPQISFPVQFYSFGDYRPSGLITVHGEKDGVALKASLDQDAGLVMGNSQSSAMFTDFAGQRGDAHNQSVDACGLCHIGDDPIWPLPETHPQKYKTNPRVCFECHSVDGQ
jgi:hypothetical protein